MMGLAWISAVREALGCRVEWDECAVCQRVIGAALEYQRQQSLLTYVPWRQKLAERQRLQPPKRSRA